MFRSTLLLAAAAFAAVASAQNYSTSGNFSIDVNQIDSVTRQAWCRAQRNTCPEICNGRTSDNQCDSNTLLWSCTCLNGNTPNVSDYQQTIPGYVCRQWVSNCVDNHPNDLDGITACQSVTCGNRTVDDTTSSTTTSASMTSSTSDSGSSGSESGTPTASQSDSSTTPSSSDSAAMALSVAEQYGTGIVAGGLLALFGLVL